MFVGTINPELIKVAIKALEYKISTRIIVDEITIEWIFDSEMNEVINFGRMW